MPGDGWLIRASASSPTHQIQDWWKSILKMLPSVGPFAGMSQAIDNVDESINGSRRKRIAHGSGTTVQDVNNLLRQYAQMRKVFKTMGSGGGMKAQQRMMSQLQGRQR